MDLKPYIAEVKDFPKPGVSFKDLTPLLSSHEAFAEAITRMAAWEHSKSADVIVAPEARGFIWGGALALNLGVPFVPVRKPGKLPRETISASYELEYGVDELHIHRDSIRPKQRVLIVDDVLATGGTARAIVDLVGKLQGNVSGLAFVVELSFLSGRDKLASCNLLSLVTY